MSDSDVSGRMRNDWNARAREDASYYAGYGGRDQSDAEFYATATGVINGLETELRRVPSSQRGGWRALEIGCGPGRLMRPMSRHFAEIHGVDVSDEMVALAKQRLSDVPQAHAHLTDGATLREFPDEWFDFVYSYAVFQHIPSQEIIYGYLREILRVTKPGGLVRLQFNGLSRNGYPAGSDTWTGARFTSAELMEFTELHDFQMLALKLAGTQYMWTTWRKQPRGWQAEQRERSFPQFPSRIRRVTNSESTEPGAPSRGYFASIFLWVENLPEDAGLHQLRVAVGDSLGTVTYISAPTPDGIKQVTVILPQLEATGLLPVELRWLDTPIAPPGTLRVIPPGPSVPRMESVTDGVHLVAGKRIRSRTVKVTLEEITRPDEIEASVDGLPVWDLEFLCTDPRPQRFEVNFRLPDEIGPGSHELQVRVGRHKLPATLEVIS